MGRYPLSLPPSLKQEAEHWAAQQGISLNQFILWAVAEKVGALRQQLDDPAYPQITYRRGAGGQLVAVLRRTGIRIQTLYLASSRWGLEPHQIAAEYDLTDAEVVEAFAFAAAHRHELEGAIAGEEALEPESRHA